MFFPDNAPLQVVGPVARGGEKLWAEGVMSHRVANDLRRRGDMGIASLVAYMIGAGLALLYVPVAIAFAVSIGIFSGVSYVQFFKKKAYADKLDLKLSSGWREIPEQSE